jgi:hypothetical protein
MSPHGAIAREFLKEHPEQIQGMKTLATDHPVAPGELMIDMDALAAFTDRAIRNELCDREKALALREHLRTQLGK